MPDILPIDLIMRIDDYVSGEIGSCYQFENREPFDDSGVYSLHVLCAQIYAEGWDGGVSAERTRNAGRRGREREAAARIEQEEREASEDV